MGQVAPAQAAGGPQLDQLRANLLARGELEALQQQQQRFERLPEATSGAWASATFGLAQQVRDSIAQYSLELIPFCVIIIYLVYYFAKVSRVSVGCWWFLSVQEFSLFLYSLPASHLTLASSPAIRAHTGRPPTAPPKQPQKYHALLLHKHTRTKKTPHDWLPCANRNQN